MKRYATGNTDITGRNLHSIRTMLFTQGFGRTLDYFCTISVFSIA
ncbi:hypothetical protein [Sideroxydans lithotrophicus]|uniref:Uncharacterized protein n=1 Tax=Sideroxydans lithotrophicus (strain ES-1) TaxID=580332 RepID=D5CML6_SIDLE|nr:hypothetical protein [Sideroxydans lithotrophicus]ADE12688.1 hypothetical protein Slit_2463 [Sideroxydans lithotrophicus ES-1]